MAFDPGPQKQTVLRKDMHRLHHLMEELKDWTRSPELEEMDKIMRRILKLDEKRYEPED
jgi:hypothetical protein